MSECDWRMEQNNDIRSMDDTKFHWEHLATGDHPGCWNDFVPKQDNIFDSLSRHQVCGAFNLDDDLVGSESVVAVLEV